MLSYFKLLSAISNHPVNASYGAATDMATLQGFVHAVLRNSADAMTIRVIVALVSALLICLVAWRWSRGEQENSNSADLMFAAAIVVSLVTGFHMFAHDLSPMLLAMLLVMANLPRQGNRGLRVTLQATLVLLWIPPLYFVLLAWHCVYLWVPVLIVFMIGTLKLES
jgi:hypothetical protein